MATPIPIVVNKEGERVFSIFNSDGTKTVMRVKILEREPILHTGVTAGAEESFTGTPLVYPRMKELELWRRGQP